MPSCEGIRQEYIECLLKSECVFINRHSVDECVRNQDLASTIPDRCQMLRQSLFECKRGLLDMRKRMRGVPNAGVRPRDDTPEDSSKWDS